MGNDKGAPIIGSAANSLDKEFSAALIDPKASNGFDSIGDAACMFTPAPADAHIFGIGALVVGMESASVTGALMPGAPIIGSDPKSDLAGEDTLESCPS